MKGKKEGEGGDLNYLHDEVMFLFTDFSLLFSSLVCSW